MSDSAPHGGNAQGPMPCIAGPHCDGMGKAGNDAASAADAPVMTAATVWTAAHRPFLALVLSSTKHGRSCGGMGDFDAACAKCLAEDLIDAIDLTSDPAPRIDDGADSVIGTCAAPLMSDADLLGYVQNRMERIANARDLPSAGDIVRIAEAVARLAAVMSRMVTR